ncbi:Dabb family protein [Endozoicomonas sp. SM1973]|uniref:Dabb family protein n=1 Tax=Spartinivicinus marinus TaxID=2994442 RepID=A0A853HU73_9GAMM|nr:Dabb family protein [Spartinivicinus marinus]MCX4029933.1 Dabb family protein [Spartinivicinus marinus]NYZ64823.1 Dabb family protein [Spartinivicinus marinus]
MIHHLVLLKCKADVNQSQIDEMFDQLNALVGVIPGLLSCKGGNNNSPEGISHGYTHAFVMQFENADARDNYLPHPAHKKVQPIIHALLVEGSDSALALDF